METTTTCHRALLIVFILAGAGHVMHGVSHGSNDNWRNTSADSSVRFLNDVIIKPTLFQRFETLDSWVGNMVDYITADHVTHEHALREAAQVALLRLGYRRSLMDCSSTHHHRQPPWANDHMDSTVRKMVAAIFQFNQDGSTTITSDKLIQLTERVLVKAINTNKCCQQPHSQTPSCLGPSSRNGPPLDVDEALRDVRRIYNPHLHPGILHTSEKFLVERFRYRLQCWDERSLEIDSRLFEKVSNRIDVRKPAKFLLLLRNILRGVPMRQGQSPCPIEDMNDLLRQYADRHSHDKINKEGLSRLLSDLNFPNDDRGHGRPSPRLGPINTIMNAFDRKDNYPGRVYRDVRSSDYHSSHGSRPGNGGNSRNNGGGNSHNNGAGNTYNSGGHYSQDEGTESPYSDDIGGQNPTGWPSQNRPSSPVHNFIAYSHENRPEMNDTDYKCLNADELLAMYQAHSPSWFNSHPGTANMLVFRDMCPTILNQLLHRACNPGVIPPPGGPPSGTTEPDIMIHPPTVSNQGPVGNTSLNNNSRLAMSVPSKQGRLETYLYSSLAVFVISACSLSGALFMRLTRDTLKTYLMASMISLAVGCLVSDAVLHLLPEVLTDEEQGDSEGKLFNSNLKRLLALLASLYGLFLLELGMSGYHSHGHSADTGSKDSEALELDQVHLNYVKPIKDTNVTWNNERHRNASSNNSYSSAKEENDLEVEDGASCSAVIHNNDLGLQRTRSQTSTSDIEKKNTSAKKNNGIKPVAWMIMIGDAIHNIADGLAIGAAFNLSFAKGLSTAITVLCHEIPHELGDFAVLVDSGMSIKRAMLLNFACCLTAFVGLYAGLTIGQQEEATKWIFTVGAGMFLYVALVDLMPECKEYFRKTRTVKMFISQNVGILFGFAVMLLLALYEDKMDIDI